MAGVAGKSRRVVGRMNLRKIHGLGVIGFVAADAECSDSGQLRLHRGGILGMFLQRPVARFAGDAGVTPGLFHIEDVIVATFAGFMASVRNGLRHDLLQCVSPIVAVFSKAFRHKKAPDNKKEDKGDGEGGCEPD